MRTSGSFLRVPAVIFAVLIGGLFVYAKSGGRLFSSARPTPVPNSTDADPSAPRIEFMMGPKSAPAFLPEQQGQQVASPPAVAPGRLLPGSKSAEVLAPESLLAQPQQTNSPPLNAGPQLLPGSKSLILVDPSTLQPIQQPNPQPAPPQQARQPR